MRNRLFVYFRLIRDFDIFAPPTRIRHDAEYKFIRWCTIVGICHKHTMRPTHAHAGLKSISIADNTNVYRLDNVVEFGWTDESAHARVCVLANAYYVLRFCLYAKRTEEFAQITKSFCGRCVWNWCDWMNGLLFAACKRISTYLSNESLRVMCTKPAVVASQSLKRLLIQNSETVCINTFLPANASAAERPLQVFWDRRARICTHTPSALRCARLQEKYNSNSKWVVY